MKMFYVWVVFLLGYYCCYAQKEKSKVDNLIDSYEEYFALNRKETQPAIDVVTHVSIPEEFYRFFNTNFIDFAALREGNVKTFSFSDSLYSPLKQTLIVSSGYGMRNGIKHFGTDFVLNEGDPVCSVFSGKVRIAKWDDTYGYVVVVRNYNMSETVYGHLSKLLVSTNQVVQAGMIIGLGGNTGQSRGAHLHFELRYKGFPINTIVNNKFLTHIPVRYAD